MTEKDREAEFLNMAVEDRRGLWEFAGVFVRYGTEGHESYSFGREAAEAALRRLLSYGFISLFRGTAFGGEEVLIPADETDSALALENWDPYSSDEHVGVGATEAGVAACYAGWKGSNVGDA